MLRLTLAVNARERAGDALGAIELMARAPDTVEGQRYWAWWRAERLIQAVTLADLLPAWAVSRWVQAVALVHMDEATRRIGSLAMRTTVQVRDDPALTNAHRGRGDRELLVQAMEHDWIHRQAFLYEHGGLRHLLRARLAPALVARADAVEEWAAAPMGGYRLLGASHREIAWRDLASGDEVVTLNLGAAVGRNAGDHVVGRVVPYAGGRLFESAPLAVPAEVAAKVAEVPTRWLAALQGAPVDWPRLDFTLLTDVPTETWRGLAGDHDHGRGATPEQRHQRLAGLVLEALRGRFDDAPDLDAWPCVAAAAVSPAVWPLVLDQLERHDAARLLTLGERLAGPAAELCWRTARLLRESA